MSVALSALQELGKNIVPSSSDIAIGANMFADPVFRKLSSRVGRDVLNVGLQTRDEIRETAQERTGHRNWLKRMLGKLYTPTLVTYTVADDSATAPFFRNVAEKTKHLPAVQETMINTGALVAFSGLMATGLSAMALRWRHNRGLEPTAKAQDQYKLDSFAATTAMGSPLRAHLGEFKDSVAAGVHSLHYVVAGQVLLYSLLDKVGTTNGFFWGGLGTYVAHRYTKDLYNGELPQEAPIEIFAPGEAPIIETTIDSPQFTQIAALPMGAEI